MGIDEARRLADEARSTIVTAAGSMGGLACVAAGGLMAAASGFLSAAAAEVPNSPEASTLRRLAGDASQRAVEAVAIQAIPWPFIYAAIGGWVGAVKQIKDSIPDFPISGARLARTASEQDSAAAFSVSALSSLPASLLPLASIARSAGPTLGAARSDSGPHLGKGPKGYRRSDLRIEEDVAGALARDSWLDASEIELSVSSGEVTLRGTASRADKRRAEDSAWQVDGVTDVQNQIRTKPSVSNGQPLSADATN